MLYSTRKIKYTPINRTGQPTHVHTLLNLGRLCFKNVIMRWHTGQWRDRDIHIHNRQHPRAKNWVLNKGLLCWKWGECYAIMRHWMSLLFSHIILWYRLRLVGNHLQKDGVIRWGHEVITQTGPVTLPLPLAPACMHQSTAYYSQRQQLASSSVRPDNGKISVFMLLLTFPVSSG